MKPVRATAVSCAALTSLLLTGTGPADGLARAAAVSTAQLSLTFDSPTGAWGSAQTSFTNSGSAALTIDVASVHGGQVTSRESRAGQGGAVLFPGFDSSASAPRAVIRVTSAGASDVLNPGAANFSWGADFAMSSGVTASKSSTSHDNGDNLVQRGLFDSSQYKLQLDGDRPSCRLRGSTGATGAVQVAAPVTVTAGVWYGATCTRSGETLQLTLVKYAADGSVAQTWRSSRTSSKGIGRLKFAPSSVPLSVGGKLDDSGQVLTTASDQFNGSVDNVFFALSS